MTLFLIIVAAVIILVYVSNRNKKEKQYRDNKASGHFSKGSDGFSSAGYGFGSGNGSNSFHENNQYTPPKEQSIPGVSEYGIDQTVFDPQSIDMNSLDPIKDSEVIGYMLAGGASEEGSGEGYGGDQSGDRSGEPE